MPALLDAFTAGGHHFVVEEFVEGQPLHEWIGCHHPWIVEDRPTPADLAEFTERVTELHSRLEHILDGIHARGVVFGDLHLGNIIVRPDGTPCLIDFELAFPVEEADRVPGLAAVGFACLDKRGVELDRYALAAVRLGTYLWLNRVCALHSGKLPRYVEAVTGAFPVPAEWGPGVTSELSDGSARSWTSEYEFPPGADLGDAAVDWPVARRSMADAMALSATPAREDRLFPGDLRQFTGGALNLATGAAGVLWVLSTAAHVRYAEYEDWLRAAVRRTEYLAPGLYSGAAGIAYLLDELGWAEDAAGVLDRHGAGPDAPVGADLFGGLAGMGLARLDRARRHGEAESRQAALGIADRIADGLGGAPRPAGTTTLSGVGLLRGWSGVALFLLRLAEDVADRDLVSLAIRAVHRDLDRCVPTRDGSLHVDEPGRRTLAYLDGGSAGIALAIDELLDHRPDERCLQELPLLLRACLPQFMFQGNLGRGRAGLLATLARTTGRAALPAAVHLQAIERHLGRLDWHAVPYRGNVAFVGDQNLRISMDLETGGAGVLLAVATATQSGAGFLPFFSRRPAPCAPEARTHPEATRSHQSPILRR